MVSLEKAYTRIQMVLDFIAPLRKRGSFLILGRARINILSPVVTRYYARGRHLGVYFANLMEGCLIKFLSISPAC